LLLRQPALHGRHPRRIQPETGRKDVPEDDLVDLLVVELRALDGLADCDGAELGGGLLSECAAERADGGAGRADDDCLGHDGSSLPGMRRSAGHATARDGGAPRVPRPPGRPEPTTPRKADAIRRLAGADRSGRANAFTHEPPPP